MKKLTLLLFAILFAFTSCEKDDGSTKKDDDPIKDEVKYLSKADIIGVWTKNENDLYFISLSNNGRYTFCFNQQLMGAGNYTLEKDSIIFSNGYLHTLDKMKISLNNNQLIFKGRISLFKQEIKQEINLSFTKTDEAFAKSVVGEKWKSSSILNIYGNKREYVNILSDYTLQYKLVEDNSLQTLIKEEIWFYIYRNSLTYTQGSTSNGLIHIYKIPFWGEFSALGSLSKNEVENY